MTLAETVPIDGRQLFGRQRIGQPRTRRTSVVATGR
jgi:hypothetical protein